MAVAANAYVATREVNGATSSDVLRRASRQLWDRSAEPRRDPRRDLADILRHVGMKRRPRSDPPPTMAPGSPVRGVDWVRPPRPPRCRRAGGSRRGSSRRCVRRDGGVRAWPLRVSSNDSGGRAWGPADDADFAPGDGRCRSARTRLNPAGARHGPSCCSTSLRVDRCKPSASCRIDRKQRGVGIKALRHRSWIREPCTARRC